jgi:hypothetical protein
MRPLRSSLFAFPAPPSALCPLLRAPVFQRPPLIALDFCRDLCNNPKLVFTASVAFHFSMLTFCLPVNR